MDDINKGDKTLGPQGQDMANKAAAKVQGAIGGAQQATAAAADKVADKVEEVRNNAAPKISAMGDQAQQLLQQGRETLTDTTQRVREKMTQAQDAALAYTKDEPMNALLAAAAAGALLMGILTLLTRSRD